MKIGFRHIFLFNPTFPLLFQIFFFCAVAAAAKATSFYGSAVIAPRQFDTRQQDFMWTQGIMNPITASRAQFASGLPVGTALTSAFATSRSIPLSRQQQQMVSNARDQYQASARDQYQANTRDQYQSNPRDQYQTQRSVQGTTGLFSGPSFMYSKGLLTNGIMGAASGIVSPMNAGLLVEPNVVRNILK